MADLGREPSQFKATDFVGALASLVIALAGSMYLASYSERTVFLDPFGLSVDMFANSVQAQIANGAITMSFFLMMMVFLLVGVGVTAISIRRFRELRAARRGLELSRWSERAAKSLKRIMFFCSLVLTITIAPGLGYWTGTGDLNRIRFLLQQRCAFKCYTYSTTDGNTVGIAIAADPSRIAIATTSGVRLIETSSLRNVAPYSPH